MSLILITGGARSGKSAFAQAYASRISTDVLFVATAAAGDAEMAARIAHHRAERPAQWRTLEVPYGIAAALHSSPLPAVVLLDCVTLWVTNLLLQPNASWDVARADLDALLAWSATYAGDLIMVTNEVGLGIVPADPLSRQFRDWQGSFNQRLAAAADAVYLLVAGIPLAIKGPPPERAA